MSSNATGELTGCLCALFCANHSTLRDEVKPLTNNVRGSLYKGFNTRQEAECAYIVAFGLGIVQVIGGSSISSASSTSQLASPRSIVRLRPTEEEILDALQRASSTFLGVEWYAVFKGIRPGVYPTWYVHF